MADNNFSALVKLIVDKTQSRNAIKKELKELQKEVYIETGIKPNISDIKKAQKELNGVTKELDKYVSEISRLTKVNSIQKWADNNSKAMKRYGGDINRIIQRFSELDVAMDKVESDKLVAEFKNIQNVARQTHSLGMTTIDKMKNAWEKFGGWTFATGALTKVWQGMKTVFTESVKLNTSITDLTMATDLNDTQIKSLTSSYSKLGDTLNATLTDVVESGTEWIKQGQSIADTETLITNSMILSKIAKLSSSDATKYLTSVMKGYKVAAEDTLDVVSKMSAVDMASATDVGGLAEGMSQVAASADLAGVSIDKLLGYLAVVGETTQSGMSEVGTMLNAVFSRMGNIKLSRLKDYETGEDLSNVETVLRGVGLSLRDSNDSFREFDEVLDETANHWKTFSETQQKAVASAFAGTHHMNEFIILMENYGTASEYTEKSLNSTGEAMQKFEEYQESVTAHTELFTKAVQDLANTSVDSGLVNFFIDLGTFGVKAIDGLVGSLSPLGTILAGLGGYLGAKNLG